MQGNQVAILYAILEEYGEETFFERLKKIYNIEIPKLQQKTIIFLLDSIVIQDEERNITYTISFKEGYYKFIKDFNDYTYEISYDANHNMFRKSFLFKTSDNKILAVDEFDEINMKTRRIIKTTKEDENLIGNEFEKQHLTLSNAKAEENYDFINYPEKTEIRKVLRMPNCLYYLSYKSKTIYPEINSMHHIIEVASSTNTPRLNFYGRKRHNNEALLNCLKAGQPNIIIRGVLLSPNEQNKTFYKITIMKSEEGITIHYLSSNIYANKTNQKIIALPVIQSGEITPEEIDNIKQAIYNNIYDEFQKDFQSNNIMNDITSELHSLKQELLVSQGKSLKQVDALDVKLNQYDDIKHLAFDVYENLAQYERYINNKLGTPPKSPEAKLKKQ